MTRPPAFRPNNAHKNPPVRRQKQGKIPFHAAVSLSLLRQQLAKRKRPARGQEKRKNDRAAMRLEGATEPKRCTDRTPMDDSRATVDDTVDVHDGEIVSERRYPA
jgi:hypothetical protein